MAGGMSVDDLGGMPLLNVRDVALRGWKLSFKRGIDLIGAAIGLVLLSPLMLLSRPADQAGVAGPGLLLPGAHGAGRQALPDDQVPHYAQSTPRRDGPGWTTKDDPRVTRIGRCMRKTNMGRTAAVDQRAARPDEPGRAAPGAARIMSRKFREHIPRYMERHREKAGMTGWAQVNGLRGDTSIEERTKYDLWYVENWSLWLDIKIILRTAFQTATGRNQNAY